MEKKPETYHVESFNDPSLDKVNAEVFDEAIEQTEHEKNMTLWQGLKTYPRAVFWSLIIALTIVMDGYDSSLFGAFYGYPAFQKEFGEKVGDSYQVPAKWQTIFSMMSGVGSIIGIAIVGPFIDKFGHRKVFMFTLACMIGIVFMFFFAKSRELLLVASLIFGLPLGVFAANVPAYLSQLLPVVLRGYLTTFINACWVIGQLIAQGVLRGCINIEGTLSYRIPFAVQWVWPPILIVFIYFAPDSPWWLVQKGRIEDAKKTVKKLSADEDPERLVKFIIHTNELEKEYESGTSYWDCFKGIDLKRTEVGSITFVIQAVCVGAVMGYSAFFFQTAGLDASDSFSLSIGQYAMGLVGTVLSWFMMTYIGRRTIYIGGLVSIVTLFFIMGCVALAPESNTAAPWVVAVLELMIVFAYDSTVGPCAYAIVSEISSTRLRNKSVAVARNVYNIWNVINAVVYPYILNESEANMKGKVGFIQTGLGLICLTWCWFRLPESKGRTYAELDRLFGLKVPARKFRDYQLDSEDLVLQSYRNEKPAVQVSETTV